MRHSRGEGRPGQGRQPTRGRGPVTSSIWVRLDAILHGIASFLSASGKTSSWVLLMIFVAIACFSAIIPPFQSPDEFDHIARAYLLGKGSIILETPSGSASGGMIDSGLAEYMKVYEALPFHPERKVSACEVATAGAIGWTGHKVFRAAPGTGYYFPLIYLPQTIALVLGEHLGLSVDASYHLARILAILAIAVLLAVSFSIYNVSPLTIALLVMPMSLFQMSSASIDGISTALAIFSVSVFLRMATDKELFDTWQYYALALSVALLATSRIHLLSLLLLVFYVCYYRRKPRNFIIWALLLFFVALWIVVAVLNTVDTRILLGATPSTIFVYYLKNPFMFFRVLFDTILSGDRIQFYIHSFFGILGWVDTLFSYEIYPVFIYPLILVGLLSISPARSRPERTARLVVFSCAVLSILLMFFALLVTWTPHPARMIEGVQGRYFLVPMIFISYAISGGGKLDAGLLRRIALVVLLLLGLYTVVHTSWLLVKRYYLADAPPGIPFFLDEDASVSGKDLAAGPLAVPAVQAGPLRAPDLAGARPWPEAGRDD
ncbi:DUF2142 domain-containing protein [Desulfolutivibrio sulfoxidireducens]|nr:DUF2142 domain-containing protein [Desulfolutivibrio sulfoxidireducens]